MKTILIAVVAFLSYSFTSTGIEGTWTYEAPTAPPGYEKGELKISKAEGDKYQVTIVIGTYEMKAEKVKVEGNSLFCQIWVDGASIPLSFTFDGDKLNGKADTPEGYVTINGKRKVE